MPKAIQRLAFSSWIRLLGLAGVALCCHPAMVTAPVVVAAPAVVAPQPDRTAPRPALPPEPCLELPAAAAPAPQVARSRVPAPTMSYRGASWLTRPERIEEEQPDRMIELLRLRPGMVVADIGAGVGYHTWRMAPRVVPGGRVIATDIQPEMLEELQRHVRARGLRNVTTALSGDARAGLPARTVDLALMVDVYHELSEPERFLADVRRALKPEGRLVLVEFRAEDPKVPIKAEHKMTVAQIVGELAAAGFCLVRREESLPWQHLMVFAPRSRSLESAPSQ